MAHQERTDEVCVDHTPPFRGREVGERFADVEAGVVHQDVELSETRRNRRRELVHVSLTGHIGHENFGTPVVGAHFLRHPPELVTTSRYQCHLGAGGRQGERDRLAEALARTGHQGYPALEGSRARLGFGFRCRRRGGLQCLGV